MARVSSRIFFSTLLITFVLCLLVTKSLASDESEEVVDKAWEKVKEGFKNIGEFFAKQIKSAKDFEASDLEDLKKKVNETLEFLRSAKTNKEAIKKTAKDEGTKKALNKLELWIKNVQDTADKIDSEGEQVIEQWKNQSKSMYDDGLDKLISYAQDLQNNFAVSVRTIPGLLLCSLIPILLF